MRRFAVAGADMRVHPLAPVVALDIDGTLARYHDHFMWFAELYTAAPVYANWLPEYKGEFSKALGMSKSEYRSIKLAYRQGGMKRSIPPMDDRVFETVQYIRSVGIQVWIATTRPWMRLDNIDPDTQFWLEKYCGRVDGVVYGEEKYKDLVDIVGREKILGVFDDLPENMESAKELGLNAVMMAGDHNAWWRNEDGRGWHTIHRTKDISTITDGWFEEYRDR